MHPQVNVDCFAFNRCHKEQLSNFYRLETVLNPLLQAPDVTSIGCSNEPLDMSTDFRNSQFSIFFGRLKNQKECAPVWNYIAKSLVENLPFPENSTTEEIADHFRSGFESWRMFPTIHHTSAQNSHQPNKVQIVKLICLLSPLTEKLTMSNGSSLVLALLMETVSCRVTYCPRMNKIRAIFKDHEKFTSWLDDVVQRTTSMNNKFCLRVAYRYYILERLRLSSRLLSTVRNICGLDSENPVKEIWNAYMGVCTSISDPDPMASGSGSWDTPNDAEQSLSLIHFKFLFALMIRVSSNERSAINSDTWENIVFLNRLPLDIITVESEDWVDGLKSSWQKYCEYLGIWHYFQSSMDLNLSSSQVPESYNRFLRDSALAMLTEAKGGWESSEWLLVLSVFSICGRNEFSIPAQEFLEYLESAILTRKTIFARVLFRYFVLVYGRNKRIQSFGANMQRAVWESSNAKEVCERFKEDLTQLKLTRQHFIKIYWAINTGSLEAVCSFQDRSETFWDDAWVLVSRQIETILEESSKVLCQCV